jgi:hypothetical protein
MLVCDGLLAQRVSGVFHKGSYGVIQRTDAAMSAGVPSEVHAGMALDESFHLQGTLQ